MWITLFPSKVGILQKYRSTNWLTSKNSKKKTDLKNRGKAEHIVKRKQSLRTTEISMFFPFCSLSCFLLSLADFYLCSTKGKARRPFRSFVCNCCWCKVGYGVDGFSFIQSYIVYMVRVSIWFIAITIWCSKIDRVTLWSARITLGQVCIVEKLWKFSGFELHLIH